MNLISRRHFITGLAGLTIASLYSCLHRNPGENIQKLPIMEEPVMQLRPHHILDILAEYGNGAEEYQPHPYGHSLHIVAPKIISGPDLRVRLVLGADDICTGCKHLLPDGRCDDVLGQLNPSPSKQAYNDVLDSRLFDLMSMEVNSIMTIRQFLETVNDHVPGIEMICTHPKENREERLNGLVNGLIILGIRNQA